MYISDWFDKKRLQLTCTHEWRQIYEEYNGPKTIYCPYCDKTKRMRNDKANVILRRQKVRNEYRGREIE